MHIRIKIVLLSTAVLVAVVATMCFGMQGGFGGGHGDLDLVLFILALPWSLVPWPELIVSIDFVWLVLLPFVLNVAAIILGDSLVRAFMNRRGPSVLRP